MGCIYSKAIARSMSMGDEGSHGFQYRSSSVAWEELLATDHLFSLVYSTKPRTSSLALPSPDIQESDENKLDRGDKSPAGSRSFHTVEEYDALLERIGKFSARSVQHFGDLGYSSSGSDDAKVVEEVSETGWKRKAAGKGIKPLEVSSTIEFPDVGMWRQQREHVEGGETYVTPKFGSYNEGVIRRARENDGGEDSAFSRELVAAFEDCMQQLQDEEESILRQLDGHDLQPDEVLSRYE